MAWQTERLVITPLTRDDAADLFAALDHPEVGRYLGGPDVRSLPWLEDRIDHLLRGPQDTGEAWINLVLRRQDGRVVGRLEATVHGDWAEVAWVLGPEHWGQGLGREAATWLLAYLAVEWGIEECWATADPGNAASLAIMRGLGMTVQSPPWGRPVASYDDGDVVMARLMTRGDPPLADEEIA